MDHPNKKYHGFPFSSKPLLHSLIFTTLFPLLCLHPPRIEALDFSFSSFAYNQTYIKTDGDAHFEGPSIYLTIPKENSTGRALYQDFLQLWEVNGNSKTLADFTTIFTFQILDVSGFDGSGDGLAFVLVGENSTLSPTSSGGLLGLFASEGSAINGYARNQVVAVEFDTCRNKAWDYSTNHIGIDINSIRSKNYTNVTDGFIDQGPANVWVVYNATTKNLSASLTFTSDSSTSYVVSYVVDLSVALPQRVQVGFAAATGTFVETHQIYSWDFKSRIEKSFDTPPPPASSPQGPPISSPGRRNVVGLVVGVTTGLIAVILISGAFLYLFRSRMNLCARTLLVQYPGPKRFSYLQLSKATNNFDDELKLGEGGFGDVYQGKLENSNGKVAVKRFRSDGSSQGEKEYVSEVNVISKLKHKNLVQLKGWCHENGELLLVYEFMSNRSLDFHLFGKALQTPTWPERYKITVDLASALHYLQDACDPFVLHRDIKSSNIMLDSNFVAKLGDFGLARLTAQDQSFHTSVPAGTLGYLAPEIMLSGKVGKASDIYSFGVVALELAYGRRSINRREDPSRVSLVEWVWHLYGKHSILEAVDVRLEGEFNQDQARRLIVVGLWCCHPDPDHRPSIRQVQAVLNFDTEEPNLPPTIPRPTYVSSAINVSLPNSSNASTNHFSLNTSSSTNIRITSPSC